MGKSVRRLLAGMIKKGGLVNAEIGMTNKIMRNKVLIIICIVATCIASMICLLCSAGIIHNDILAVAAMIADAIIIAVTLIIMVLGRETLGPAGKTVIIVVFILGAYAGITAI